MFKRTLHRDELEEEYTRLDTPSLMIIDTIYDQISFNWCLANAFTTNLGHHLTIVLLEVKRATGKEIAEHVNRPANVFPASYVQARCVPPLNLTHRLWKVLKPVEVRRERRMVGKRMILVLM